MTKKLILILAVFIVLFLSTQSASAVTYSDWVLIGDFDMDGYITETDVQIFQDWLDGNVTVSKWGIKAGDIDGDGITTPIDRMHLLRHLQGLVYNSRIGTPELVSIDVNRLVDAESGIALETEEEAELTLRVTAPDPEIVSLIEDLIAEPATASYTIELYLDGESVSPESQVIVRIPYSHEKAKVFRLDDVFSASDMKAMYEEGYLVFVTDRPGVFAIAEKNERILGDADGDGEVTSIDVTNIQRAVAHIKTDMDEETLMNADADRNGLLEIIDATYIQRYLARIPTPYSIGEAIS